MESLNKDVTNGFQAVDCKHINDLISALFTFPHPQLYRVLEAADLKLK